MSIFSILLYATMAYSQTKVESKLISPDDKLISIKTVAVAPFKDNVNGVYAKPIQNLLTDLVKNDSQWSYSNAQLPQPKVFDLSESLQETEKLLKIASSDALLWSLIQKGHSGLKIKIVLFTKDGRPLLVNEVEDTKNLPFDELKLKLEEAFRNMKKTLPYGGLILSRTAEDVTLNLGAQQGVQVMDELSVIQVLKVNRHPVKNFMVSNEKEIVGKIKITKVEPSISFGKVIFEKEAGFVIAGSKVLAKDYVSYPNPSVPNSNSQDVAFGNKPKEWTPANEPQFGKVTAGLTLTNYELAQTMSSSSTNSTNSSFSPGLDLGLEVWINPDWYVDFKIRQVSMSVANPMSNSTPSRLNMNLGKYGGFLGYRFLSQGGLNGPSVKVLLGLTNTEFASSGSSPVGVTTMKYSGFLIRFESDFDVMTEESHYLMGLGFDWHLFPSLSENYSSGAASTNRVYSFDLFFKRPWSENINMKYDIKLENYNSDFSGSGDRTLPAANITHSLMTLGASLEYLF